jgi:hypothetical protein
MGEQEWRRLKSPTTVMPIEIRRVASLAKASRPNVIGKSSCEATADLTRDDEDRQNDEAQEISAL